MIVPTIIPSTVSYAQPTTTTTTTLPPNDPSTRTFGPQTTNNITSTLNNTAASGIQNMLELSNMLEPEIKRYDLVKTFNDVVYAFGFIQGNLTALQNQTIAEVTAAESTVGQLRAQISTLQDQLEAARADLAEATAAAAEDTASDEESEEESDEEEEETEEGSEEESEEEEEDSSPTTTSPSQTRLEILETLVNNGGEGEGGDDGPRTDPEGDGGFPGDIDG